MKLPFKVARSTPTKGEDLLTLSISARTSARFEDRNAPRLFIHLNPVRENVASRDQEIKTRLLWMFLLNFYDSCVAQHFALEDYNNYSVKRHGLDLQSPVSGLRIKLVKLYVLDRP